jgi:hypothetical protein
MTTEQINEWKAQYGGVYELPVEDKVAYLREPKVRDFKMAFKAMQDDGDIAFGEVLLNCLMIAGDDEVKTNDDYFNPARKKLMKFFNYEDAELERKGSKTTITIGDAKCVIRVITREDVRIAERKNPSGKPFVTQEQLFERVCIEKDDAFKDKDNASIRLPLYQALEELQNQKVASLKKL